MKDININGLSVTDYKGNGKPLILVHAFPLSSRMWEPQVKYLRNKFRVITYDARGLGKSRQSDNQFTMESYVTDFFCILDELGLDKVNACGVSMGGYIILRAITRNSERFLSVILADTRAERDDDKGLISRSNSIIDIKSGKRKEFLNNFLTKLINDKSYANPEIQNFLTDIMFSNSDDGICGAMLALATRTNTLEKIKDIDIPSLIIVGEDDVLTPKNFAEAMNKSLKNSVLEVVPNAGHLSNIENPDYFNSVVIKFLDGLQ
ncbi:MAG: alpha/beta hydrolase [Ignavibacteria bacterium]|nr:alpha/beta hydrolase [Ignavibacteria bacterium]